jgi:glycine/sarcosine N-methyltransferase
MREHKTQRPKKELDEERARAMFHESSGLVGDPTSELKRPEKELSKTQGLRLEKLKQEVEEAARAAEARKAGTLPAVDPSTLPSWQLTPDTSVSDVDEDVQVHTRELLSGSMYDDLINWDFRLTRETPLFNRAFSTAAAQSVCDVGCGTGRHAVMFAQWGMHVIGVDSTMRMVKRASDLAAEKADEITAAGGSITLKKGDLGSVTRTIYPEKVNALVCVGDMLPQVGSLSALRAALDDFAEALLPSGVLVLEFANHTRYNQTRIRSTTPAVFDTTEGTKVFLSVMDYPVGSTIINSDAMTLTRNKDGKWRIKNARIQNLFISPEGISRELIDAGFDVLEVAGDFTGRPLAQYEDESMVIIARRKRHRPRRVV